MFTTQHYKKVAEVISSERENWTMPTEQVFDNLVDRFVELFAEDNSRFNRELFRKACNAHHKEQK